MNYNGFEIDMLSVGDADCTLITEWTNGVSTRVLIDGGNAESAKTLKGFLEAQGIYYIEHVVCTHPHDDHAAGLVEFVKDAEFHIGTVWVHRPERHVNLLGVELALNRAHGLKRVKVIREALETVSSLILACEARGITIAEPFAGGQIGCLTVMGPSERYYAELLAQFADSSEIQASDSVLNKCDLEEFADALLASKGAGNSDTLMDSPPTSPENNSSVILATRQQSETFLFTADAGAQALALAAREYRLGNCDWMQIPHHGSRRNITVSLIQHFSPKWAFVSAAGNTKHPRRAVVNAFKKQGAAVYSTHYPRPGNIWHHRGNVPARSGYAAATALWDATT
ncbi:MAG: MBL fold metallo-hydrolase [Phycisphaerae bacterium]|nr:MBL fold metallo-hydrolase [Phycisphaerae bacterium]